MTTFADLGIPFPLFAAPTQEASEYVGLAACVLCGQPRQHCVILRIGCAVLLPCPACTTLNGLDTSDRQATPCRACHREVHFPDGLKDKTNNVCYACLRAGKGVITKDTEFGMVSWEQAFAGVTQGVLWRLGQRPAQCGLRGLPRVHIRLPDAGPAAHRKSKGLANGLVAFLATGSDFFQGVKNVQFVQ